MNKKIIIAGAASLVLAGIAIAMLISPKTANQSASESTAIKNTQDEPPLKLKSIGINLDKYNPTTGKAGDLTFTKEKLQFDVLFTQYGYLIPGSQTSTGKDKSNPQPTFYAPLGTKVTSLVDGVVVDIPKLYSDDYSVMVAENKNSQWIYETEHVTNVVVNVGDKVTAGQVVAEVSPHDKNANAGLGLFEIGILKAGNPPQHVCPFAYLDQSVKEDIQNKLRDFYQDWNDYKNKQLYDSSKESLIGCLTLDLIDG